MKSALKLIGVLVLSIAFAACGGGESNEGSNETTTEVASTSNVTEVTISGNDAMQFDTDKIEVAAGTTVKLTLTHSGTLPKAAMGHNFVLLAAGTDLAAFAGVAMTAMATDYIPADMADSVIASTTVIGGGESVTIEFEAPAAGTYAFLCTFPGHFGTMQGTFVVK